ncbi:MAG: hypothetical protein ACWA5X_13030 [bacterium]
MKFRTLVASGCALMLAGAWGSASALVVDVDSHNNLWYYGTNNTGADTYQFNSSGDQSASFAYQDGYDHLGDAAVKIDLTTLGASAGDTLTLTYNSALTDFSQWDLNYGGPDGQNGGVLNGLSTYAVIGAWASAIAADGSFQPLDPNPTAVDTASPLSREFDFVVGTTFSNIVIPDNAVALFLGINGALSSEIDYASADKYVSYRYDAAFTASGNTSPVPVPPAIWMMMSGVVAFMGLRRRNLKAL